MKSPTEKTKIISIEANRVFKPNESFGMCDSDIETQYDLYDRVITVRLGTGVPLGTRGTIIGILLGQTHLDTYYEVLFDHLPKNSLDAILFGGNNQQCRIKVRSYHLLNYSHSLRVRSMMNYQQQRSMPSENVWEKRLLEQSTTSRQTPQQPTRILKRTTNDTNTTTTTTTTTPKSAPASTSTQDKSNFIEIINASIKEQKPTTNPLPSTSTEKSIFPQSVALNSLLLPPPVEKLPEPEILFLSTNAAPSVPFKTTAPSTAFPTNSGSDSLLLRAIQESKQLQNPPQQQSIMQTAIAQQRSNMQAAIAQQEWDAMPPPPLSVIQQKPNDMSASIQQAWGTIPAPSLPAQSEQSLDSFISHPDTWETPPRQQIQNPCM
jgi:hypothetical protein